MQENYTNSSILTHPKQFKNDQDAKLFDDCELDYKKKDETRDLRTCLPCVELLMMSTAPQSLKISKHLMYKLLGIARNNQI